MKADAIVAIVEKGKASHIVNQAKAHGAQGATIFYARGTGAEEAKTFLNLKVDAQKEVIIIITSKEDTKKIFDVVVSEGNVTCPGKGIVFVLPVSELEGFHLM